MKLKKGSAAAKAYMAKIRAKRKKVTKSSVAKPKRAAKKAVNAAKKKAAKKETSIHKDTASHNVRISVVSGVNNYYIGQLRLLNNELHNTTKYLDTLKQKLKASNTKEGKTFFRAAINEQKAKLKLLKHQISQVKKHIK